jgi:8-oxo-dGTP pyrophosphatase MutT (NUDIX family)
MRSASPMLKDMVEDLKEELRKPLPGTKAQLLMAPEVRRTDPMKPAENRQAVQSGVVILLYADGAGNVCFPLIQRPTYNGAHSGQIGLPGGKFEHGDKDLVHTALREMEEEIGVGARQVEVIGKLSPLYIWVSNFNVQPVIAYTEGTPTFHPDPTEVTEILPVRLSDLVRSESAKKQMVQASGNISIEAPTFSVQNKIVWGATAMVLSEFFYVLRRRGIFK